MKAFDTRGCLCFKGSCPTCLNATTKFLSSLVNVIRKLFAMFCTSFLNLLQHFPCTVHFLHFSHLLIITSAYIFHFPVLYRQDHQRSFFSSFSILPCISFLKQFGESLFVIFITITITVNFPIALIIKIYNRNI